MDKKELQEIIDVGFDKVKDLIIFWHDKSLERIRLTSSNNMRLEDHKSNLISESKKRHSRFNQ